MTLVCSKKCWQIFDCSGRLCPNDSLSGLIAVSSALQLSGVILFGGQPLIAPLEARGARNSILVSQLEQSLTHASRITLPIRIRIHLYNLVTTCTWSFHRISAPLARLLNCQLSGKVQRFPLLFVGAPATSSRGTRQTLRPASFSISPALSQHLSALHVVSACTEIFLSWSLGRSSFLSTAIQKRIWFPDTYS